MTQLSAKEALKRWKLHCEKVQMHTTVKAHETEGERKARIKRLLANYSDFVDYYFPHYTDDSKTGKHTPSAPFHIKAANTIRKNYTIQYAAQWARGHAKSTHFDIFIPMWLKANGDLNVMVLVGKSEENANTLLGDIQAELEFNQRYIADFGLQKCEGSWQSGEFVTADGTAFFARGRGQSPRGLRHKQHRPDYIVIDDLDDDELVNNPDRVKRLTKWVKEALFGTLDGGRGRFIMVGNLIGKCSVMANFIESKGVVVSKVNAIDKNGKPSWAAKYDIEEINAMAGFMGYTSFQREMMNNPITEGAVFRHDWIKWKKMLPLAEYDSLVAYCDPSFKGSSKNDYKAIKLWGKKGTELHHIAAFVRQCSVAEMVRWFYDLYEHITAANAVADYLMEGILLQDIILDEFTREGNLRGYQMPIRADRRKKPDKFQRIEAISPLWERGFVYYNIDLRNDPDMTTALEQTLAFEKGMSGHDDAPDADEGAIYILQQRTRKEAFPFSFGRRTTNRHQW